MNRTTAGHPSLESLLAGVLQYGSWIASAAITIGVALALIAPHIVHEHAHLPDFRIVTLGIALFILLPVFRVFLMLLVLLRDRDYRFSAIAALVLAILILGFLIGMRAASATAG